MSHTNIKGFAFSSVKPARGIRKIAERNVAKQTEEIKNKVRTKQQSGKNAARKKQRSGKNTVAGNPLKLLVTIVNRNKAEYYIDLIQSFDVNMQCVLIGQGTADKSTLGLLGLTDSDKAVILSVVQHSKTQDICATLESKFNAIKGGKGVAWTIPLTSVIGKLIYGFLSNNRETVKENKQ